MRKKIKTLVTQDFEVMKPFIIRDEGRVPPILFFHFKDMDEEVSKKLNETVGDDVLDVEKGFFVPMTRPSVLEHRDVFMSFLTTVMATLDTVGITGALHSVVITLSGEAVRVDRTGKTEPKRANVFISSGVDAKGDTFTKAQEIKIKLGSDSVICDLVDTDFIDDDINNTANVFLKDFFKEYEFNKNRISEDKENLGLLEKSKEDYKDDPAGFTADLIDSAVHATALVESFKQGT